MTREEAYNRIDCIIAKHEIDDEYVTITNLKDYEALRMARKILEQEPVLDKIRSEIMQVANQEKFYDEKWALGLRYAVNIIDKYKAEKEE